MCLVLYQGKNKKTKYTYYKGLATCMVESYAFEKKNIVLTTDLLLSSSEVANTS